MNMGLNTDKIIRVIESNGMDNVICRALELRSTELAKYICGLANKNGGYILIGVEKRNGCMEKVGCLKAFDVAGAIEAAKSKISSEISVEYGFVFFTGINIFVVEVARSEQCLFADGRYYEYENNDVKEKPVSQKDGPITLFISYTECDTPIVDIIEEKIKEKLQDKIRVSRYTELQYKGSFKAFMNTIQDHDYVLTVVSDTYLKRQACMYEVGEIIKDHHYKNKLLFVVLSEKERKYFGEDAPEKIGPEIYKGAEERLEYVGFWKKRFDSLKEKMSNIDDFEAISKATEDLKILGQIYRNDMGEFLDFLADENGKNFETMYENDFNEILLWLK